MLEGKDPNELEATDPIPKQEAIAVTSEYVTDKVETKPEVTQQTSATMKQAGEDFWDEFNEGWKPRSRPDYRNLVEPSPADEYLPCPHILPGHTRAGTPGSFAHLADINTRPDRISWI